MTDIIQQLAQLDEQAFLFLNGLHHGLLDYFMVLVSNRFTWVPLYASFIFVMVRNFHWKVTLSTLLCVALVVLLCDQTSSGLLKPMVERLRPSNLDNPISPMVHIVDGYRGGRYGFPSSHSANSWGLAFFGMQLVRNRKLSLFLVVWALVMSYSRIYLGVHYTGDILVGAIIGCLMGTLVYLLYHRFARSYTDQFRHPAASLRYDYLPISVGIASFAVMLAVGIGMGI